MKKSELIDKLFNQIEKDKKVIKENLIQVMDYIKLETNDELGNTISFEIKYRRNRRKGDNDEKH